ncbi:Hypothetical protein mma_2527 [Janthinobacterium sp. Marseille]|nr:hypothetical protein [Janthinobacterium sp. Marseille]ABR91887.1 Hypothetical protein mma_2527 [Janthinobacterium sp. Marseille]
MERATAEIKTSKEFKIAEDFIDYSFGYLFSNEDFFFTHFYTYIQFIREAYLKTNEISIFSNSFVEQKISQSEKTILLKKIIVQIEKISGICFCKTTRSYLNSSLINMDGPYLQSHEFIKELDKKNRRIEFARELNDKLTNDKANYGNKKQKI